ncbi:MAG: DegT/DnrJ/EryC1/StrS aminotransferase family protein [Alphaproteobacteria bacterium]|nr:DegT/DnrJ/EryC1/StrS aminotransferase family protein [Alphaproteobacteria bacterium]
MLNTPFAPWPCFTTEEAEAVSQVLLSNRVNYWTGDETTRFEEEFAAFTGAQHAIAVSNGTVALDLALRAVGIQPGDEVIVTPRTFIASVSCATILGAVPVFADVDADSQNITADTIRPLITPRTRAIVCVHLAGWPCEMDGIMALAAEHRLAVIEDCAQATGSTYRGRSVGVIGHIGAWSFCQDKIITTGGDGGMITTNDPALWSWMWSFKEHGKSWTATHDSAPADRYRWLHESFGTNGRMVEMQAAIGRIQLARLPDWVARRTANAERIAGVCRRHAGMRVPVVPAHMTHAYYKFYAFVTPERLAAGWTRDRIIETLRAEGVPCYSGICPEVYLEKAFDSGPGRPAGRLPIAKQLGETSLMFLVHPSLTAADIDKTCTVLGSVLTRAESRQ